MKTAEEVSKGLAYDIALAWCKEQHQQCDQADEIIPIITQALTAFSDERVMEAQRESVAPLIAEIRDKALEEAAKAMAQQCEDLRCSDSCYHEHTIRALKEKL